MGDMSIRPYICVSDARAALDWYGAVFGGRVTHDPVVMDDGRVVHRGAMAEMVQNEPVQQRLLGLSLGAHQ